MKYKEKLAFDASDEYCKYGNDDDGEPRPCSAGAFHDGYLTGFEKARVLAMAEIAMFDDAHEILREVNDLGEEEEV